MNKSLVLTLLLTALFALDAPAQGMRITLNGGETDRSGTITLGGTAQQVMAANTARMHLLFQNISDTDMYIRWTGTASAGAGSVLIPKNGGAYENPANFCPNLAVSVFCVTTGKAFTAVER